MGALFVHLLCSAELHHQGTKDTKKDCALRATNPGALGVMVVKFLCGSVAPCDHSFFEHPAMLAACFAPMASLLGGEARADVAVGVGYEFAQRSFVCRLAPAELHVPHAFAGA